MSEIVKIDRINNFEYSFKLSSKNGIRHVAKALTFRNPDPYAYSSKIEKFDKKKFTFKIGMLPTLKEYIKKKNLVFKLINYDFVLPENIEIDDRMSGKYIHQAKAVEAFYKNHFGIIVVPTRGGKTFIASEILRIFLKTDKRNFLFLTDSTTLFTQVINDFNGSGFFEIDIPNKYIGHKINLLEQSNNISILAEIANSKVLIKVSMANPMYAYLLFKL